jgi:hypothetical protein
VRGTHSESIAGDVGVPTFFGKQNSKMPLEILASAFFQRSGIKVRREMSARRQMSIIP